MKVLLIIMVSLLFMVHTNAQDSIIEKVEIVTNEGNRIIGTIVSESDHEIVIDSPSLGTITIKKTDIKRITKLVQSNAIGKGSYASDFHNSTHYLVNPSGYNLKRGQMYYENIGIFFNSFAIGITDRFSVAAGGEIASLLFGQQFPILYVSPRYSFPFGDEAGAISVGGTIFSSPSNDFDGFGVFQTAFTLGSRNNNFTIGGGIGFNFYNGFRDEVLPLYASFMIRLSRKLSLVSDNFIILYEDLDEVTGVLSVAVRIHSNKLGLALNAGLWRPTEDWSDLIALPFVSATIPLGK